MPTDTAAVLGFGLLYEATSVRGFFTSGFLVFWLLQYCHFFFHDVL